MKKMIRKIRNVVLETTTVVAFIALCTTVCCLDTYNPVIIAIMLISATWLGLFFLANGVFES